MIKLGSKKFYKTMSFKFCNNGGCKQEHNKKGANFNNVNGGKYKSNGTLNDEIKWEVRPGGMLVQNRSQNGEKGVDLINIRVSSDSKWHHISIESTSSFGELKMILSLVSGLEREEQRLLFKGKEREDEEHLHMVGVKDKDKIMLLQDPAIKEMKLHGLSQNLLSSIIAL